MGNRERGELEETVEARDEPEIGREAFGYYRNGAQMSVVIPLADAEETGLF